MLDFTYLSDMLEWLCRYVRNITKITNYKSNKDTNIN